jgi:programmed cell death 6-interacting protein
MKAQGSQAARDALKQLMIQVETLRGEREALEAHIKNMNFDLKSPFLSALAQDGAIDEPNLSTELLGNAFAPLERQVKESLEKQESLVVAIQQNSDEYFGRRDLTQDNASQRDQVMRQLAEGFDAFTDLQNNIREGTKFYNDLTQLLLAFQNKISDYCFARKTEKEELLKDVTRTASNVPTQPSVPPARPPPPTFSASAQQPASNPYTSAPAPLPHQQQQQQPGTLPYPTQYPNMPLPFQAQAAAPYPYTPMPAGYNPYAAYAPVPPPQGYHPYPVQPMGYAPHYYPPQPHQQPPPQ